MEEQLAALFKSYERTHGQVLLINGMDYRETVREQWAIHEASKENEKLQRVCLLMINFIFFIWLVV